MNEKTVERIRAAILNHDNKALVREFDELKGSHAVEYFCYVMETLSGWEKLKDNVIIERIRDGRK